MLRRYQKDFHFTTHLQLPDHNRETADMSYNHCRSRFSSHHILLLENVKVKFRDLMTNKRPMHSQNIPQSYLLFQMANENSVSTYQQEAVHE